MIVIRMFETTLNLLEHRRYIINTSIRFETSNYDILNRIWQETSFTHFAIPNYG